MNIMNAVPFSVQKGVGGGRIGGHGGGMSQGFCFS